MDDNDKMITSDDSSDNTSSDDENQKLEERALFLEKQLSDNKYSYEPHVEVVDVYRKLGDLKSMRAAYERFSTCFPLTPTIWLEWIESEIKLAVSSSEKKYVLSLFDKAVEDYLSIHVWLEYIHFCIDNCTLEETRAVVERSLNAGGLAASEAHLLWDALIDIEMSSLSLYQESSNEWKEQVAKIVDVFKRKLSVPLLQMESYYEGWEEWLKQLPDDHKIDSKPVEWGYHQALKTIETYKPFEMKLQVASNNDKYDIYKNYIKAVKDPATILCLFERAVADLSLNPTLWNDYCSYSLTLGEVACLVSEKACRNCPWQEELWIMRLRILEQQDCPSADLMQCLEQGLTAIVPSFGLDLWMCYLEYVRRSSQPSEHLYKVFAQAAEQLGEMGDPTCKILRLEARLCAREGNIKRSRQIWKNILHSPQHKYLASAWLEYAHIEKQYGDPQHLRMLYQNALSTGTDWPGYIIDDWLMFERECGSLQDMLKCVEKCKNAKQSKPAAEEDRNHGTKRAYESNDNNYKAKRMRSTKKPVELFPKRTMKISDMDVEKTVFLSNLCEDVGEEKLETIFPNAIGTYMATDRKGNSRCFAYIQFASNEEAVEALTRDREPIDGRPLFISKCLPDQAKREGAFKYSQEGEKNKLFVRGLPISLTQDEVKDIFKEHEAIAVRLVLHRSGRSKGIAYVEFTDEEQAQRALEATNQLNIRGHIITVAISAPPPKKQEFSKAELPETSVPMRNARSRLQVPLIPRSLKQPVATTTTIKINPKSNEDFRKMFSNNC